MATTIPDHYTTEFGNNWLHLVQQKKSRLKDWVQVDTVQGKEKTYNQMDTITAREITTRNGDTVAQSTDKAKRWLRLKAYDTVSWIDEWDDALLGEVVQPDSAYVRNHGMAFARRCDQTIIDNLTGSAYTGADGTTATALGAGQAVAVGYVSSGSSADSNLTLDKLIKAKSILGVNEAYGQNDENEDMLCLAVSQNQLDALLRNVDQIKSSDYNNVKALVEGEIHHFMGFKFMRTQLLAIDSNNVRTCVAWVKSGVQLAVDSFPSTKISILDTKNETIQIRTKGRIGSTRLEEKKVVSIACDEDL